MGNIQNPVTYILWKRKDKRRNNILNKGFDTNRIDRIKKQQEEMQKKQAKIHEKPKNAENELPGVTNEI